MKENQTIKCNVYDCVNCDVNKNFCSLKEIKVCEKNNSKDKKAICNSYEKK